MLAARKLFVALFGVVMLTTTAQPALAVDDGFRGKYIVIWNEREGNCGDDQGIVNIRYLSETRRRYDPKGSDNGVVLRYRAGESRPWQWIGADGGIALRYSAATTHATGLAWEAECTWRVTLGWSDPPSDP